LTPTLSLTAVFAEMIPKIVTPTSTLKKGYLSKSLIGQKDFKTRRVGNGPCFGMAYWEISMKTAWVYVISVLLVLTPQGWAQSSARDLELQIYSILHDSNMKQDRFDQHKIQMLMESYRMVKNVEIQEAYQALQLAPQSSLARQNFEQAVNSLKSLTDYSQMQLDKSRQNPSSFLSRSLIFIGLLSLTILSGTLGVGALIFTIPLAYFTTIQGLDTALSFFIEKRKQGHHPQLVERAQFLNEKLKDLQRELSLQSPQAVQQFP